jgi:hypothetical protein
MVALIKGLEDQAKGLAEVQNKLNKEIISGYIPINFGQTSW